MRKYLITTITIVAIAAWTCPVAAFEAGDVNIHGFISQGFLKSNEYNYLAFNSKEGSFEYNEMGVNFSSQLTDRLRAGLQFFSRDLGDAANNKIILDWAYGDYRYQDWLGLRAGRVKLPMGLHNETRDMDMLRTNIVLPQGIYNDLLRDNLIALNGVGIYGNADLRTTGSLNYQLISGSLYADNESGIGKFFDDGFANLIGGKVNGDNKNDTSYSGALQWDTPLEGFKAGYSFFKGSVETPVIFFVLGDLETIIQGRIFIEIYSAEYTWNNLVIAAEYMEQERMVKMLGTEINYNSESYYLSASYAFNDWFTLGTYYAEYYPDKSDKEGKTLPIDHKAWEKDIALTLRFDINDYWIIKIEGHTVDGTANVLGIDNADNNFSESDWYYSAAKITFSF